MAPRNTGGLSWRNPTSSVKQPQIVRSHLSEEARVRAQVDQTRLRVEIWLSFILYTYRDELLILTLRSSCLWSQTTFEREKTKCTDMYLV